MAAKFTPSSNEMERVEFPLLEHEIERFERISFYDEDNPESSGLVGSRRGKTVRTCRSYDIFNQVITVCVIIIVFLGLLFSTIMSIQREESGNNSTECNNITVSINCSTSS